MIIKVFKFLLISIASLICFSYVSAQTFIHSGAIGKTVHFTASPRVVGQGNQLFTVDPPIVAFIGTKLIWGNISRDTTLPKLKEIYTNLVDTPTGYGVTPRNKLMVGDRYYETYMTGTNWGTYLSCTDLATGSMVWDAAFNVSTTAVTRIYPNPIAGRLTFDSVKPIAVIRIHDLNGQTVLTSKLQDNQYDIAHLPNGIYFIDINSNGRIERHKIRKIK